MFRHIYIHVPYCVVKCPYCDFFSVADDHRAPEFLTLLERELDTVIDTFGPLRDVETIFIGGGTPTHLTEHDIVRLGMMIRNRVKLADSYEWTVEANPESATHDKLRHFHDMGANRISLGVQSFHESELELLGRAHTIHDAMAAVDAIHRTEFTSWSLDLMFGIAGQSVQSWQSTLAHALTANPPHISAYALMIEPGSAYAADHTPTRFQADDDTTVDQFIALMDTLHAHGYAHYEVSNYALSGHRCRHNDAYWQRKPYVGLGPSAHSFAIDEHGVERRWWNVRSIDGYLNRLARNESPIAGSEILTPREIIEEQIMLGLRRSEGICWEELPPNRVAPVRHAMEPLATHKLVCVDDMGFRIIRDGWPIADMIIRRAVDAIDTDSP